MGYFKITIHTRMGESNVWNEKYTNPQGHDDIKCLKLPLIHSLCV